MGWTYQDFRNDVNKYEELLKNETDPIKRDEIVQYITDLKYEIACGELASLDSGKEYEDAIRDVEASINGGTNYGSLTHDIHDVSEYRLYDYFIDDFRNKLHNILEFNKYILTLEGGLTLSEDDIVGLVHDLFKSTNKEIFNYYLEFEKNKDKILNFNPNKDASDGTSYNFPLINSRYIEVGTDGKCEYSLETLTHELGHFIGASINPRRYASKDKLSEIESLFFELVGNHYYNKVLGTEFYIDRIIENLYNYYEDSKLLGAYRSVVNGTYDKMNSVKDPYAYYKNLAKKNRDYKNIDYEEKFKYTFGYICAVELFEVYKEDKELALHLLKEIIKPNDKKTEFSRIVDNIDINKHVEGYAKRLIIS